MQGVDDRQGGEDGVDVAGGYGGEEGGYEPGGRIEECAEYFITDGGVSSGNGGGGVPPPMTSSLYIISSLYFIILTKDAYTRQKWFETRGSMATNALSYVSVSIGIRYV